MKRFSFAVPNLVLGLLWLTFIVAGPGRPARAAESGAADASTNGLTTEDVTTYANLNKTEFESGAQARLARELAQVHLQRADDAKKGNQPDKANWEADLAKELSDKAASLQQQMNEATRQRIAFEGTHKPLGALLSGTGPNGPDANETAFLTRVDERLYKASQELTAAIELGNGYAATLQTNTSPQQISTVSDLLERNNKQVRQLEKEKADLELQRLEYRALRRR